MKTMFKSVAFLIAAPCAFASPAGHYVDKDIVQEKLVADLVQLDTALCKTPGSSPRTLQVVFHSGKLQFTLSRTPKSVQTSIKLSTLVDRVIRYDSPSFCPGTAYRATFAQGETPILEELDGTIRELPALTYLAVCYANSDESALHSVQVSSSSLRNMIDCRIQLP